MVFRRGRMPFRRRRRSRSETYTLLQCRQCINVWPDPHTCATPGIDLFLMAHMSMAKVPGADTTEVASPSERFLTVKGIKFQSEHLHDPVKSLSFPQCDPDVTTLQFLLTIREAIMVLPTLQGPSIAPAYLPNLASMVFQGGDSADRVLWKRLTILPIWGLFITSPFAQLQATHRDTGHGPVVVKSRVKLDDRHGLYYVRNWTHDVVTGAGDPTSCSANGTTNPCVIPVEHEFWAKIFYGTKK